MFQNLFEDLWVFNRSKKKNKVLKASPLGNAVNYFIYEYTKLSAFLKDGRYEIDNGWIERAIRKFAIGRNDWGLLRIRGLLRALNRVIFPQTCNYLNSSVRYKK